MFQPDAGTRPTQLTVFELKVFVNYRIDELNTTIFAACTSEHNRLEMHLYNLNKSIHCVNNIDERRSEVIRVRNIFLSEILTSKNPSHRHSYIITPKRKQGSPVSISLQNISI